VHPSRCLDSLVYVPHLYHVKAFPQVHAQVQMLSTNLAHCTEYLARAAMRIVTNVQHAVSTCMRSSRCMHRSWLMGVLSSGRVCTTMDIHIYRRCKVIECMRKREQRTLLCCMHAAPEAEHCVTPNAYARLHRSAASPFSHE
jgi:hypothetical protein